MSDRLIYPRLARPLAVSFLNEHAGLEPEALGEAARSHPWRTGYYAVGTRAEQGRVDQLRLDLETVAKEHGFPEPLNRKAQAAFDRDIGLRLLDEPILDVGADDVWANIGTAQCPHLTAWRWGWPRAAENTDEPMTARQLERFLGGFRNSFRRTWYRLSQFGSGPDDPPATFWEDAIFNVEEKPSLGGNRRTSTYVFWATQPWTGSRHNSYREQAFRDVTKTLIQIGGVRDFNALDDGQMQELVTAAVIAEVPEKHESAFLQHFEQDWPDWRLGS